MASQIDLGNFPSATMKEWLRLVDPEGGTGAYQELLSRTLDGFEIQPLYGPEEGTRRKVSAELFGGAASVNRSPGWGMVQEYAHPSLAATRRDLAEDFRRGASGAWLWFHGLLRDGVHPASLDPAEARRRLAQHGLAISRVGQLASFLECLDLSANRIYLSAGRGSLGAAALLLCALEELALKPAAVKGCLGCDPLSDAAQGAAMPAPKEIFRDLVELARWSVEEASELRAGLVSTAVYHQAGASPGQELGIALASGLEALRAMGNGGLSLEAAASQLLFCFQVTGDLFLETAKLRAARLTWARLLEECGVPAEHHRSLLHVRTSARTATVHDRGVNALRGTVETFAAILGGADTISTAPYDEALGLPRPFSRKVAANTQLILREESFLDAVADPAGGSWYVEALTEQLAEAGWKVFQNIEKVGGMAQALQQGRVRDLVREVSSQRKKLLANRRQPITGTSEFPDLGEQSYGESGDEEAEEAARQHLQTLAANAPNRPLEATEEGSFATAQDLTRKGWAIESVVEATGSGDEAPWPQAKLDSGRDAESFEFLREASARCLRETGARPRVYLANFGPIKSHRARSGFARNLLNVGGIEAVPSVGDEGPDELAEGFAASACRVAVLCGSDEDYGKSAVAAAEALRRRGARILLLAGKPGDLEAELRRAGVSGFLFLGMDVVEVLQEILESLGVEP